MFLPTCTPNVIINKLMGNMECILESLAKIIKYKN